MSPVPLMATFENRSVVSSGLQQVGASHGSWHVGGRVSVGGLLASYEVITAGPNASHYLGPTAAA